MISRKNMFFVLVMGILNACTDPGTDTPTARAVVEAYLRPGKPIDLTISKESLFVNSTIDTVEYIDGLTVTVSEGENNYLLQSVGNGKYVSDADIVVVPEKVYSLYFTYGDQELTASTYIPSMPGGFKLSAYEIEVDRPVPGSGAPPERPEPIEASWENPNAEYHLVVVTVIDETPEEIETPGGVAIRSGSFRNEPNTETSYDIRDASFEYYGMHAVILYKLNPEYATLYEESGSSSLNLKAPYSNVANGLGIFTGVNSDTLYLDVKRP